MNVGTTWTTVFSAPQIKAQASRRHLYYHPATMQCELSNTDNVQIRPIGQSGYITVPPGGAMRYDLKTIPDGIEAKAESGTQVVNPSIGELFYANDNIATIDSITDIANVQSVDLVDLVTQSRVAATYDGTNFDYPRIDASTNTYQSIPYEHHEIHSGSHYFLDEVFDLANNQVLDITWLTPDSAEEPHPVVMLSPGMEIEWFIYEGAVATNQLANLVTPPNNNRRSQNTSNQTIRYEIQASLAAANTDTSVATALQLGHGKVGSGRTGGIATRDNEIVMDQATLYCLRVIALAAGYINTLIEHYEHTPKH